MNCRPGFHSTGQVARRRDVVLRRSERRQGVPARSHGYQRDTPGPEPCPTRGMAEKVGCSSLRTARAQHRIDGMARTVLIVLFDGVQSLDVTGPMEVFAHAERAA